MPATKEGHKDMRNPREMTLKELDYGAMYNNPDCVSERMNRLRNCDWLMKFAQSVGLPLRSPSTRTPARQWGRTF